MMVLSGIGTERRSLGKLRRRLRLDDRTALIMAASFTHMVRLLGLTAIGALDRIDRLQRMMRTAHVAHGLRRFSLGYSHP